MKLTMMKYNTNTASLFNLVERTLSGEPSLKYH